VPSASFTRVTQDDPGEQLALIRAAIQPPPAPAKVDAPAATDPVASVRVDTGLAHLDRPFEYLIPEALSTQVSPGVRVKVRFAGQDLDGFVVGRGATAEHVGRLAPIRRVVSAEPVLTPAVLAAAEEVARGYAGTVGDVLRLAVPPRHATAERALGAAPSDREPVVAPQTAAWEPYPAGRSFLSRVAGGWSPAASLLALPGQPRERDWPQLLAESAAVAAAAGRGALLVVPDARDVARVEMALASLLERSRFVRLTADQGSQARYTAFLKVLRGHAQVVVGTRSAAFAPVRDLGLVAWWDDGDDLHEEPRAPYPHVREILAIRARLEGAALLSAGFARTAAIAAWCASGEVKELDSDPLVLRRAAARVRVAGEGADLARDAAAQRAHLPSVAWQTAKDALARGAVLVQVPRRGYLPSLACQECRTPARCRECSGPLALPGRGQPPACRWCGRVETRFTCPECGSGTLRSSVVGARRTAEELGRAFPSVPVHTSGSGTVLDTVPEGPRLVIATPGAEPVPPEPYAAVLLLDAWALLDRPALAAGEEALRRWLGAAALCRGAAEDGTVVLCGAPGHVTVPPVEALVRWDPDWAARRELAEREALALPPTRRVATLEGSRYVLQSAIADLRLPPEVSVLGPVPKGDDTFRVVLTAPLDLGPKLAAELTQLRSRTSARKDREHPRSQVDPPDPAAP
jgi:primosomal protein N' (replication factor Y)